MTNPLLHRSVAPLSVVRASLRKPFTHVLVLLFISLLAGTALAQTPLTYNDGDLFLGFRSTDGTSDYLVNIGQPSQFTNASAGTTLQVTAGNLASDLTTAFGSDWYSRIDPNTGRNAVLWAIVGGRQVAGSGDPANTLYSSNPSRTAWPRLSDTNQSFTTSLIAALGNNFSGNQSTASNPQGLIQSAAGTNSYAAFQPPNARSSGISFQTWNPSNEASPIGRLFFDRIASGSGASTVLGAFTLASNGQVSFTAGTTPIGQFLNIATRMKVLTGDNALFAGVIVTGSAAKKVCVRALGPSLGKPPFNLNPALDDPIIELHDASTTIASNDNWGDDATQAVMITAAGLAPADPKESALITSLNPGQYSVIVRGKPIDSATGIGTVEVYDLDQAANSQLLQISSRGLVGTGDSVMIAGLTVGPGTALNPRVACRGIGPSLSAFGITNPLPDPLLELHDSNGATVQSNDDWQSSQQPDLTAAGLALSDPKESGIVAVLPPGAYTAILKGKGSDTGIAIVEAFNLQ